MVGTYTANESVTWSLAGGADAARFTLTDGVLAFVAPSDFESPSDSDQNNTYFVVLRATDAAGNRTDRSVTVTVQDLDEIAPEIAGPATPSVMENTTTVATYTANESVTWTVTVTERSVRLPATSVARRTTT